MPDQVTKEILAHIDEHLAHKEAVSSNFLRDIRDEMRAANEKRDIAICAIQNKQAMHDEAIEEWNTAKTSLKELLEQWNNAKGFGKVLKYIFVAVVSSSALIGSWKVISSVFHK
jgi:hypothetical protein